MEREQPTLLNKLNKSRRWKGCQVCAEDAICRGTCQKYLEERVSQQSQSSQTLEQAPLMAEKHMWQEQGSITLPCLEGHSSDSQQEREASFVTQLSPERMVDPNATEFYPYVSSIVKKERDLWANTIDPLLSRTRPTVADAAHIEAADIQRVQLEEHVTLLYPTIPPARRRFPMWQVMIIGVLLLALSTLLVDGLLLLWASHPKQHPSSPTQKSLPTLTLSPASATVGQTVFVQLAYFSPLGHVLLTHDNQQSLLTTTHTASVALDANGQAVSSFVVGRLWGVGSHLITAQDMTTRVTASALLQVTKLDLAHYSPSDPLMSVVPLNLNFSVTQAQAAINKKSFSLINDGNSVLTWHSAISTPVSSWLTVAPMSGRMPPHTTSLVTVTVATKHLAAGTYTGQIVLTSGYTYVPTGHSLQLLTVSVLVQPPCSLVQTSASSLLFDDTANSPQTLAFMASGGCAWPLSWKVNAAPEASWLTLTPTSGSLTLSSSKGTSSITVNTSGLQPGIYHTFVNLSVVDAAGAAVQNSSQPLAITLTVRQACTLHLFPTGGLIFSAVQGASPASQTLAISTTGSCPDSVAWVAGTDLASNPWLDLSTHAGLDAGNGSTLSVTVTPGTLTPGVYTGQIVISAGVNGAVLRDSPQTVSVTFTITS